MKEKESRAKQLAKYQRVVVALLIAVVLMIIRQMTTVREEGLDNFLWSMLSFAFFGLFLSFILVYTLKEQALISAAKELNESEPKRKKENKKDIKIKYQQIKVTIRFLVALFIVPLFLSYGILYPDYFGMSKVPSFIITIVTSALAILFYIVVVKWQGGMINEDFKKYE